MMRPLGVKVARRQAEIMEMEASRFYSRAASLTSDVHMRELLNMLADEERKHQRAAGAYEDKYLTETAKSLEEESHHRLFVLQFVQPGLAGLMDGSVSTLAPLFAAAFATHKSWDAFLVGMRQASAPAYPWASPSRFLTMARLPGAGPLGFAAR